MLLRCPNERPRAVGLNEDMGSVGNCMMAVCLFASADSRTALAGTLPPPRVRIIEETSVVVDQNGHETQKQRYLQTESTARQSCSSAQDLVCRTMSLVPCHNSGNDEFDGDVGDGSAIDDKIEKSHCSLRSFAPGLLTNSDWIRSICISRFRMFLARRMPIPGWRVM